MTHKFSILALLVLCAFLQLGCNNAIGENPRVVQVAGDGSKSAGVQQDVPGDTALALAEKEAELAKRESELTKKELELEKQKREFAEARLKQLDAAKKDEKASSGNASTRSPNATTSQPQDQATNQEAAQTPSPQKASSRRYNRYSSSRRRYRAGYYTADGCYCPTSPEVRQVPNWASK